MKRLLLVSLAAVLASCAVYKPPATYTFDNERTFNKGYDETWTAIIDYFAEANTPIKTLEKASGFIATEYGLRADSRLADCGKGGTYSDIKGINGNVNVTVRKVDDAHTKVRVNCTYRATKETVNLYKTAYNPDDFVEDIDCNSTGAFETGLFDAIASS